MHQTHVTDRKAAMLNVVAKSWKKAYGTFLLEETDEAAELRHLLE